MRQRELVHKPYEIKAYVCLGCGEQSWPGRDGLARCQNNRDLCGTYVKIVVHASEGMQAHLSRVHRYWETTLHERLVAIDEKAKDAA